MLPRVRAFGPLLLAAAEPRQCIRAAKVSRWICSADSYHGPGGLSARQIMAKVQEAERRDAGCSPQHAQQAGAAAADMAADRARSRASQAASHNRPLTVPKEVLEQMSVPDLVSLLVARGVAFSDITDERELVARAIDALGELPKSANTGARHHPAYAQSPAAAHLRGKAVDRSAAEARDPLD